LDGGLILIGAGISVLFISSDGNGQNPVPVAGYILVVVLVAGAVSFVLARFSRSLALVITASVILTDLLFVVCEVCYFAYYSTDAYAGEAARMFPVVFTVEAAPAIVLASIGFGRFARRFWQKRTLAIDGSIPDR
jgi:hypothetical protein